MKKVFLLLSAGVLLASCGSGYQPDGPDQVKQSGAASTEPAAGPLDPDSSMAAKATAVARQPQIDTSNSKIGTGQTGTPANAGAKLIAASDCLGCHREREKLLGPAYTAVAAKYPANPANIAMLSEHIIKGGAGHWGDIAMTPHPALSEQDSKQMVSYILSLK